MDIQLDNLIAAYPATSTPKFQQIYGEKKEFGELSSDINEKLPPGRGHLYKHQKLTQRTLRAYNKIMTIAETGTGKSCQSLSFLEYSRKEIEKYRESNGLSGDPRVQLYRKIVIIVKGKTQKAEIKQQLACRCSDGRYETEHINSAKDNKAQRAALTARIKGEGYEIITNGSFANSINKLHEDAWKIVSSRYPLEAVEGETKSQREAREIQRINTIKEETTEALKVILANRYSDTIIWIDEAHNIIPDDAKIQTEEDFLEDYYATLLKGKTTPLDNSNKYWRIWQVLHHSNRGKHIISTATPMIDSYEEIIPIINLLLPLNNEIPADMNLETITDNDLRVLFPKAPKDIDRTRDAMTPYFKGQMDKHDISTLNIDNLEPFFRGKISYIRSGDDGVVVKQMGKPLCEYIGSTYQSMVYVSVMSDKQRTAYEKASSSNNFYMSSRHASNFVFPDGSSGSAASIEEKKELQKTNQRKAEVGQATQKLDKGYDRFVNRDKQEPTKEFATWLTNLGKINELGCKVGSIVEAVQETQDRGNTFIYSEFVEGSGCRVVGFALEGQGYSRYTVSTSSFKSVENNVVRPLCGNNDNFKLKVININKGLRYALLTQDTTEPELNAMLELFNSHENRHGEYLQVLISSRVGRDGINLKNVIDIHLLGPEWNRSSMYQAESRGIRTASQEDLLAEERQRLITEEGLTPEEALKQATVEVRLFRHAAIMEENDIDRCGSDSIDQEMLKNIDLRMYASAEDKDRQIRSMMRILKRVAIDCNIHKDRNMKLNSTDGIKDVDYSAACDYDTCEYDCYDPIPAKIDYSTYDVYYLKEIVEELKSRMMEYIIKVNAFSLQDITAAIKGEDKDELEKHVLMVLQQIIYDKESFRDKYGYLSYLKEDNGMFYTDRFYSNRMPEYAMAYYNTNIVGITNSKLDSLVMDIERVKANDLILKMPFMSEDEIVSILEKQEIEAASIILEDAILKELRGEDLEYAEVVKEYYNMYIFRLHKPEAELASASAKADKKRREDKFPILKEDLSKPWVYAHTLKTQKMGQTSYNIIANYINVKGDIRLLDFSESEEWTTVAFESGSKYNIYSSIIKAIILYTSMIYDERKIYLLKLFDGALRVVDSSNKKFEKDGRKINRGKECINIGLHDLYIMLSKIGAYVDIHKGEETFSGQYKLKDFKALNGILNDPESSRKINEDGFEDNINDPKFNVNVKKYLNEKDKKFNEKNMANMTNEELRDLLIRWLLAKGKSNKNTANELCVELDEILTERGNVFKNPGWDEDVRVEGRRLMQKLINENETEVKKPRRKKGE